MVKENKDKMVQAHKIKYDGIITNMWFSLNIGAILTAFSIQQYIKINFNKDYKILYYLYDYIKPYFENSSFENFANKYLNFTHYIETEKDLKNLNSYTDNFIVGSDQVFRYLYIKEYLNIYLLLYTNFLKKRIAFSASFGRENFDEADEQEKKNFSKYLKRFDYISTREKSGVDICKNEFNIKAEHILDPVFLVDKNLFDNVINDSNIDYKNSIVSYILDETEKTDNILEILSTEYKLPVKKINPKHQSPSDFLNAVKNGSFIITDSFHGVCFALIYHKKFICIRNKARGYARFQSLIDSFNISNLFVDETDEILNKKDLFEDYNYEFIDNVIKQERKKAKIWFKTILQTKKKISLNKILNEFSFNNKLLKKFIYKMYQKINPHINRINTQISNYANKISYNIRKIIIILKYNH